MNLNFLLCETGTQKGLCFNRDSEATNWCSLQWISPRKIIYYKDIEFCKGNELFHQQIGGIKKKKWEGAVAERRKHNNQRKLMGFPWTTKQINHYGKTNGGGVGGRGLRFSAGRLWVGTVNLVRWERVLWRLWSLKGPWRKWRHQGIYKWVTNVWDLH